MDMNVHMKYDKTAIFEAFNAFSEEQIQTLFDNLWFKTFQSSKEPLQAVAKWQESIMYLVELTRGSSLRRGIDLGPWWMLLRGYITVAADRQIHNLPMICPCSNYLAIMSICLFVRDEFSASGLTHRPSFPIRPGLLISLGKWYYWTRFWGSGMLY